MNEDQVREALRKATDAAGSPATWAKARGMSAQYVADVLAHRRQPGAKILAALGLERVTTYRRLRRRGEGE